MTTQSPGPSSAATGTVPTLDALVDEARRSMAARHPFLRQFAAGTLPDPKAALRRFAREYGGLATGAGACLRMAQLRLPTAGQRALLGFDVEVEDGALANWDPATLRALGLRAEQLDGVPSAELYRRFARSLGWTEVELATPTAAAAVFRGRLLEHLDRASPAELVGALLFGGLAVERPVAAQLLQGILGLGSLRRDAFAWFELCGVAGDLRQRGLWTIATELAGEPGGREGLAAGMRTALQWRVEFWDRLYGLVIGLPDRSAC